MDVSMNWQITFDWNFSLLIQDIEIFVDPRAGTNLINSRLGQKLTADVFLLYYFRA